MSTRRSLNHVKGPRFQMRLYTLCRSISLSFLTSLPPTLSCTSCTESSCSSLCKMQIPSTAVTLITLSPSARFSLPLSTCTPGSMHQFSVAPPNAVCYNSRLNLHHCVVVVIGLIPRRHRSVAFKVFVGLFFVLFNNPIQQKACILVFSAHSSLQSVAEEMWLYPTKTMRGSVASQAGAVDRLIAYIRLSLTSILILF